MLTYTARGFRSDAASDAWQPGTPAGTSAGLPSGTIQLKSNDAEIRDTQWLAALAAATFSDLDPERVVVSGNSYGGGESWLQSTQSDWTFPRTVDARLPVLRLKVAVPKSAGRTWATRSPRTAATIRTRRTRAPRASSRSAS